MFSNIYKIENVINKKVYIGKTKLDINKRFTQHVQASKRVNCKNRPLYKAFKKYGTENFTISLLEVVDEALENEKEIFWISFYDSFKKGYNATLGGDGKQYVDRKLVLQTYNTIKSISGVCEKLCLSFHTVSSILKSAGVTTRTAREATRQRHKKHIKIISPCGTEFGVFENGCDVARWLLSRNHAPETSQVRHISYRVIQVCKKERRSCYGLFFEYA